MPRHSIHPTSRFSTSHGSSSRRGLMQDPSIWERMDRAQVLGTPAKGHRGCVNALSWSDDGSTLLSGSDDKRICIWASDPESSNTVSPHPMKLVETIATGHRANIFSAKYLPNTNTPTIVTCAGDNDIRVFEVERLSRANMGAGLDVREELYGLDGPGVLRCHRDRTKRIATENSPNLFLTVSEDGTVRQHDLRRPHVCRSECPEPLFRAPRGIDLYSLSVSVVAPHIFSVAGRTDVAYVCDRRMPERQTPSWGNNGRSSGQVHCVRRLGLSNEQWESMGVSGRGVYSEDRHITCVKMSPDNAEEVICAFAQHSTSIFSLYDSPESPSMRHRSSSPMQNSTRNPAPTGLGSPSTERTQYSATDFERDPPLLGKRRVSERSSVQTSVRPMLRARPDQVDDDIDIAAADAPSDGTDHEEMDDGENRVEAEWVYRRAVELSDGEEESGASRPSLPLGMETSTSEVIPDEQSIAVRQRDPTELRLDAEDLAELRRVIEGDDDEDELHDMFDLDDMDEDDIMDLDDLDEDADDYDDYDDIDDDDDDAGFGGGGEYGLGHRSDPSEFAGVDMLLPRRSFKGARNMETVKDCNFLGSRSDKVCSGSDDGNFFVWDKDTGRLEGIWEGDAQVVNVMQQHPTLPLVAVSGIDNTVKLFSPLSTKPTPSFSRVHLRDSIIRANTDRLIHHPPTAFGGAGLLEFLASRGFQARVGDDGGEPQCTTQ